MTGLLFVLLPASGEACPREMASNCTAPAVCAGFDLLRADGAEPVTPLADMPLFTCGDCEEEYLQLAEPGGKQQDVCPRHNARHDCTQSSNAQYNL